VTCEETALSLGAYVLGALEPEERREVREHLSACPACAAEYADLKRLPLALDHVTLEDLHAAPAVTPSPDLFDRVASAAVAEDRRVRRRWLMLVAAVAALFLGGVGATAWVNRDTSQTVVAGDVRVTVDTAVDKSGDGTILDVSASGLPPRSNCHLVVVDDNGRRHDAGSWMVDYEGEASYRGWADVPEAQVADLEMRDDDGDLLVRVPL
jgi:hypothetical protein